LHPFNHYPLQLQPLLQILQIKIHPLHPPLTFIKHKPKQIQLFLSTKPTQHINPQQLFKQTQPLPPTINFPLKQPKIHIT
ncbi:hypothetical protein, partial [Staphylococcus hominis]|uniref:hypothetical protein n=1 Tax=Staphylococcus hominis TaxID=1290 RepID=UPI001C930230